MNTKDSRLSRQHSNLWTNYEEHNSNPYAVLKTPGHAGLRLRGHKCEFKKSPILYLGHRIDGEEIHQNQEKFNTICKERNLKECIETA